MSDETASGSGGAANRKRQQAPAVPDGWAIGAPDFIGVGAHRAGTTWWWALLCRHPEIDAVPRRKELHLLESMREGPISEEQRDWYYRQFPTAPGHIAGEWTTRYMTMPPMPGIIAQIAPQAKLLVLVRDPVERYRSGLTQWEHQTRSGARKRDEKAGKREALKRGFYGRQIGRLVERIGLERILVQQYERCVIDPAAEYARTIAFLERSPYLPEKRLLGLRQNMTTRKKVKLSAKEQRALVEEYADEVRLLKQLAPSLDLALWPNFSGLKIG